MSLQIVTANTSNAEDIATIGKKSFAQAFGDLFISKEDLQEYLAYTYNKEKLIASIQKENNIYFVALLNGTPVGFAKIKKHSLNEHIKCFAQMELQKLYVLFEYHGSGIGKALMDKVILLAQKMQPDYLWLDTHVSNTNGIRFYEKNGFKKIAKHHFTIGTQTFEYHVMALPVEVTETSLC